MSISEDALPTEESIPSEDALPTEESIPAEDPLPTEESIPAEEPLPAEETAAAEESASIAKTTSTYRIPPARFVKRSPEDKNVGSVRKTTTLQTRPLHLGYKPLPKEETLRKPDQKHGHRQPRAETGMKTQNQRARARIEKVMDQLHDE